MIYFSFKIGNHYPIPKKRVLELVSNLDLIFFREKGEIKNCKKILRKRVKVIETIFLHTIIKAKNNQNFIRTIEYEIDLNDLLFDKIKR